MLLTGSIALQFNLLADLSPPLISAYGAAAQTCLQI